MTPDQAKALRDSATNIVAYENQLETQRKKLYDHLERVSTNARQAVMMAEEATREEDLDAAAGFNESAEVLAQEIVDVDAQIARIDIELIEAHQAADEAKSVASDSAIKARQMQTKGIELRAEFERAKAAGSSLDSDGVPSFDEVKSSIGERLAKAEAVAEIDDADGTASVAAATSIVEAAAIEARAAAKLAEIRSQMGIGLPEQQEVPAPTDHESEEKSSEDDEESD